MITWSTNATGADLSNIIDFMDLPQSVQIVSLNVTVDSGYCGTYTCTEEILSGSFSKQVTVDVGESILLLKEDIEAIAILVVKVLRCAIISAHSTLSIILHVLYHVNLH